MNWEELKTEYVTTDITYHKMCQKYGIPYKTLALTAKKYHWVEDRHKMRTEVAIRTKEKVVEEKSNHLIGIAKAADKLADLCTKVMEDENQFFRRMGVDGEETISKKLDTKSMKELASTMKDLTQVLRNVYNIPTEQEEITMQLARERLEIERQRAESEEQLASTAGVVLIPSIIEENDDE